ncbi:hypothetical protein D9V37_16860 [Nocardioides mangrovicus]|uniref:HIT family protein n=1 Tax=Nocardioides mangrovicus TaxID=2478913 RepID=A0A3L8P0A2_9ACTN|nr:hypothetical protein [Nocardioides mangrovicus]RLV47798.1 hypothetical protein D9V37_16860 [Nocardioides mangrovicus]
MPESPEALYARVTASGLNRTDVAAEATFPWQVVDGTLEPKPLAPPAAEPVARTGADGCPICASLPTERTIWENDDFFVSRMFRPSGLLILFLQTKQHIDFTELDDDLAAATGRWEVILCRIVERLPHVAQTYVIRFGSGAEHLHLWFVARPDGFPQIRGSLGLEYDEILPPIPEEVLGPDLHEIARELATHGGRARV